MFLVTLSPGIFVAISFMSIKNLGESNVSFNWMVVSFFPSVNFVEVWALSYLLLHGWWTINAYRVDKGKISENVCWLVAGCSFIYMLPIYASIWLTQIAGPEGVTPVGALILTTMLLPGLLAGMEDLQSLVLYLLYLPWFLVFSLFFLVFFPSYSFARLYDTTWGNRETGAGSLPINEELLSSIVLLSFFLHPSPSPSPSLSPPPNFITLFADAAVQAGQEETMRFWTRLFVAYLLTVNFVVFFVLQDILINSTYIAKSCFMVIMFWPFIVQLVCAILFFVCFGQHKNRKKQIKKFKADQRQLEMMRAASESKWEFSGSSPLRDPAAAIRPRRHASLPDQNNAQ